jgi:hypothetical protein
MPTSDMVSLMHRTGSYLVHDPAKARSIPGWSDTTPLVFGNLNGQARAPYARKPSEPVKTTYHKQHL